MIIDLLKAIVLAGIPVGVISYYLIKLVTDKVEITANNSKELSLELKTIKLEKDAEESYLVHMLRNKFMKFGGGFYGVLALITYIHIEFRQVLDFMANFKGFADFIDQIGFSMLINFFIEALMNLVSAFVWPIYWHKYLPIGSFWIWMLVVIVAHTFGSRRALSETNSTKSKL